MKQYNSNFRTGRVHEPDLNIFKKNFIELIAAEFYKGQQVFTIDDSNREKIAFIFNWVIGKIDLTLNKGLLLTGDVGTGKSSILKGTRAFCKTLYPSIFMIYITADQISRLYDDNSVDADKRLKEIMTCKLLFIDDFGYEALKVYDHYPLAEVIRERYDRKRITCLTTNLKMEEIPSRGYGKSFEDKLNEMCFLVKFEGESKR